MARLKKVAILMACGLATGAIGAALFPVTTEAVLCEWNCSAYICQTPMGFDCNNPYHPYAIYRWYSAKPDVDCDGPFTCSYAGPIACVDECGIIDPGDP